jgi:beta-N-acetylhexosaminidase
MIAGQLASRTLVGQHICLSLPGPTPTPAVRAALTAARPAGVILFARNIVAPDQLAVLCTTLQGWAAEAGLPPLLIGIDQEGGTVSRLPAPFITPPSPAAQGRAGPAAAYACALLTARQLRACGVNLNFAPALDVNSNPANPVIGIRSFSSSPAHVAACGRAALAAYRAANVIATVKHFPGHGDTTIDSHLGLPVLAHSLDRIEAVELAPFRALLAEAPALMTAHVVFQALDDLPATLSPQVIGGLLRETLGYDGLVFTDALDMRAIADRYGAAEASRLALRAGADIVMPLGDLDEQIAVVDRLAHALEAGELALETSEATSRRLNRIREAYALGSPAPGPATLTPALQAEFAATAIDVARSGVLIDDPGASLPLRYGTRLAVIDCMLPRFNNAEEAAERGELLRALVMMRFPQAEYRAVSQNVTAGEVASACALVATAEATLLITRNACFLERQVALGHALSATGTPLIHVAARSPDDCGRIPALVRLAIFGDPPVSLAACIDTLTR